jgi:hypothetical protein
MHHQGRRGWNASAARKTAFDDRKQRAATHAILPGNNKALSPNNLVTVYCARQVVATAALVKRSKTAC